MNKELKDKINYKKEYFILLSLKGIIYNKFNAQFQFVNSYSFPMIEFTNEGKIIDMFLYEDKNKEDKIIVTYDNNKNYTEKHFNKENIKGILKYIIKKIC